MLLKRYLRSETQIFAPTNVRTYRSWVRITRCWSPRSTSTARECRPICGRSCTTTTFAGKYRTDAIMSKRRIANPTKARVTAPSPQPVFALVKPSPHLRTTATVTDKPVPARHLHGSDRASDYRKLRTSRDWPSRLFRILAKAAASSWRTRSFDRPSSSPKDSSVRPSSFSLRSATI